MRILVLAEHDNVNLKSATANAIAAAARLAGDVEVLVVGEGCRAAAEAAARLTGVARVTLVDAPHYAEQTAENLALFVADHGKSYSHVLAAATQHGKNVLPRVAALLDVAQISDIIAIEGPDTFVRPIYAGNALATVKSGDTVKVITVRTTAFAAAPDGGRAAPIERLDPGPDLGLCRLVRRELTQSGRPELAASGIVVSGGRGLGSKENYDNLLGPLADVLGAALGASRAAVDSGFASNDQQVGQTGKIVAPQLYIAVGISGAIQHLAGMKESKVIVAINKDAEAPIFQVADYGLCADLFQAVPELTRCLGAAG
jgi:electron transfer flavoprotein alpha subunit